MCVQNYNMSLNSQTVFITLSWETEPNNTECEKYVFVKLK